MRAAPGCSRLAKRGACIWGTQTSRLWRTRVPRPQTETLCVALVCREWHAHSRAPGGRIARRIRHGVDGPYMPAISSNLRHLLQSPPSLLVLIRMPASSSSSSRRHRDVSASSRHQHVTSTAPARHHASTSQRHLPRSGAAFGRLFGLGRRFARGFGHRPRPLGSRVGEQLGV